MAERTGKMSEESNVILNIEHICRNYRDGGKETQALQSVDFSVKKGEFVSIIGASGCGKTTLLRLIAGLDVPQQGRILLNGEEITKPSPKIGYIFQQGNLFQWQTVRQNIGFGLRAQHRYKENKEKIEEYIELIGLKGFEHAYPHQISGGMAQRVSIARSLICEPSILLLDEPMGALDSFTRADMQDKLLELKKEKDTTMILVTHDIDEAVYLSDRVVIMTPHPGKISEIVEVGLPKPRHRGSESFFELRRKFLERFEMASAQPQPEYVI